MPTEKLIEIDQDGVRVLTVVRTPDAPWPIYVNIQAGEVHLACGLTEEQWADFVRRAAETIR